MTQAFRKISLADLESRPGWNDPSDPPLEGRMPRGECLVCRKRGPHRYARKVFAGGGGYHVLAECLACGGNARGAGQWVSRLEVVNMGWRPDDLPESTSGQGVLL